jgi:nucleoside-diphosphate-sugar epimerase
MSPTGLVVPTREDGARVTDESEVRFAALISRTEDALMAHDAAGHFRATLFRYPQVYGPYQVSPREWCVMRRALDRRAVLIVPEGGLMLVTRGWAGNLAHAVLLAVDRPDAAAGQIYNCGDERQLTVRQWAETIAAAMRHRFESVSAPDAISHGARWLAGFDTAEHRLLDIGKSQRELGYTDVLPVEQALARTVEWYLAHPLQRGGALEQRLDPFDYAAEDRVVAALARMRDELADLPSVSVSARPHAYAHPREPGLPVDHRRR